MSHKYGLVCTFNAEAYHSGIGKLGAELRKNMEAMGAPMPGTHFQCQELQLFTITQEHLLSDDDKANMTVMFEKIFREKVPEWQLKINYYNYLGEV